MKNLIALLQSYAREKDYNQGQLSKKIGIDPRKLSKLLKGGNVDAETLVKIQVWMFK